MSFVTHKNLSEWASSMGFSSSIPSESFQKLLTPQMKPCWTHIITLVKPIHKAQMIQKNILLSKLRPEVEKNKVLTVRADKLSQIPLIRNYEQLTQKINKFSADTTLQIEQIQNLQQELKKIGSSTKKTVENIAEKRAMILILKKKRELYEQKLKLNSLIDAVKNYFSSSDQVDIQDKMEKLEQMLETVCHSQNLGGVTESEKEMIHDYIMQYFKDVSPALLINSIISNLQSLSRDVAIAAASTSANEESIRNELDINGGKNLEERLQDCWQSLVIINQEVNSLKRSSMSKVLLLKDIKTNVLNKMLQVVGEEYEEEVTKWLSLTVQNFLVSVKIQIVEKENCKILDEIENSEYSVCLFDKLTESIQMGEYNIESTVKKLQENLSILKKNQSLAKIEYVRNRIHQKIKNFQNKMIAQAEVMEKSNPFSSMTNLISVEVSQIVKTPLDALRCKEASKLITQDVPSELQSTPYTPAHFILQDNVVKACWVEQFQNSLEDLQPSPILEYNIDNLVEDINANENATHLELEESVLELNQLIDRAEKNVQEASENVSFWIHQPYNKIVLDEIIL